LYVNKDYGHHYVVTDTPLQDGTNVSFECGDPDAVDGMAAPVRAMVARPITHLIFRLGRTDWNRWGRPPNVGDSRVDAEQLALDPNIAEDLDNPPEPRVATMLQLAEERRRGLYREFSDTWGLAITQMQSLQRLEFVLETFGSKKDQLETVVECAKTWRFPLDETDSELIWDGRIEDASYGADIASTHPGYAECYSSGVYENNPDGTIHIYEGFLPRGQYSWMFENRGVEVRIITYTRRPRDHATRDL
jgi:hypothetical protein